MYIRKAIRPESRWPLTSHTALPRPTTASAPLSKYLNGFEAPGCAAGGSPRPTCRACWIATVASPGSGLPSGPASLAASPITEISGWPGQRQVGVDLDAPGPVRAGAGGRARATSAMPAVRTPAAQTTVRVAIRSVSLADLDRHAACVDVGDHRVLAHRHAELAELLGRLRRGRLAERGDHALAGVEQDHPRRARVDPPEVALHRVAREDRELPGDLDAGRPAADDDERQPLVAGGGIGSALGLLEGAEDPVAEVDRVLERLQPARDLLPLVVAEVGRLAAAGDDQAVVVEPLAAVEHDLSPLDVDVGHRGHQRGRVRLALEHVRGSARRPRRRTSAPAATW